MTLDPALLEWMLDSDPALRWQVQRDLAGAPPEVWQATRASVAHEGFGAQLLALQDADGQWAGGAYFPGDFDFEGPEAGPESGQPYTATTWSLNSLREWGTDAAALGNTAELIAANSRWEYNDLPYWGGEVDCCINAFTLANGAWLGADVAGIAQWFLAHQMNDGGWNCAWEEGSTRSSFHSTINSLKGLLYYEEVAGAGAAAGGSTGSSTGSSTGNSTGNSTGGSTIAAVRDARHAAEEYLLQRKLLRTLSTGDLVAPWVDKFVYPFRWFYSVLNAADYFRAAALHNEVAPDPRLAEAIELIRAARTPEGTWIQERRHPGRVWFEVDVAPGEPSKWLTFYGTRVLNWWDEASMIRS